ncbi:MAG: ATP-binding protein [Acidobacteriota bacterium]
MPFLRDGVGNEIALRGPRVSIGRSEQNDVVLRHGSVSRVHAQIDVTDEGTSLKDLNSRLGTFVNGQRVFECKLRNRDEIRFGQVAYRYHEMSIRESGFDKSDTNVSALLETVRTLRTALRLKARTDDTTGMAQVDASLQKALDGAELLDRQHRRLTTLYEVSGILNEVHDTSTLLEKVIDLAIDVLHAENGFLMLKNQSGELEIRVARGMDRRDLENVALSRGLAHQVASSGQAVLTQDAGQDERFKAHQSIVDLKLRSILCVPMKNRQQEAIGVIYLGSSFSTFVREDIDLMESFANQSAVAIDNMRLLEESKRGETLSAIGRMASTIIHDLKNPITSVSGYAELIAMSSQDEQVRDWSRRILREIDRVVGMTGEILAYARGEENLNLRPESVRDVLQEAMDSVEESMDRCNVSVVTDIRFAGKAMLDRDKFSRVIFNIANNAREAMAEGGRFTVSVSEPQDGYVEIRFQDTGYGIPEEVRKRIFEPFVTHGKKRGIGLGMAIVRKLVEVHRGTVAVESVEGLGTTIIIRLPVLEQM